MSNLLNRIKESSKYVSDNSKYVKINYEKIDEIIEGGEFNAIRYWLDTNPFNILDMNYRDIVNFLLLYHTIGDYCFWGDPKWEIDTEVGKLDGSYAIMYILINRFRNNNDMNMSYEEFADMLKGNVEIPLLKERYNCLVEMNKYLDSIGKDFYDEIKDLKVDIDLLDYVVSTFSYFKDETDYNGVNVYFYKRAQLLVSDILHVRKMLENIEVDYSNLMGCADYKIPQVMNALGMLEYEYDLEYKLARKEELQEDSIEEIEIRANDLVVIDYIYEKLNREVCRMDINDYIWLLGQDKSKINKNYHRTRTIRY
ncbi:MAG: hypothetical protein E7171_06005 [Firmicutes bacterium]|nr:hypothetical protein [Bacillota bacterium]